MKGGKETKAREEKENVRKEKKGVKQTEKKGQCKRSKTVYMYASRQNKKENKEKRTRVKKKARI